MSEDKATGQKWLFSEPAEKREWPAGAHLRQVGATIVQEFDTLRDAIEAAEFSDPKNRDQWADAATGKGKENKRAHWYGIDGGPADVAALVRDGWPEGVQRMREALDDIGATLAPQNVRRVRRWADSGDSVEMPRVWAGRLGEAWQRTYRTTRPASQVVTIAANVTALFNVDARALFWRGAAVLKLADMLTEAGYSVKIDAIRYSSEAFANGCAILQRATIKAPTAPLELNGLASTVCLAGFFRTVYFKAQCAVPLKMTKARGYSAEYPAGPGELAGVEACTSADTARAWINQQLLRLEGAEALAA